MGAAPSLTVVLVLMAFVTAALAFIPYYIRRSESFGVSIPENEYDNPRLRKLRLVYCRQMLICGLVFIVATGVFMRFFPRQEWVVILGCVLIVTASFVFYLVNYRQSLRIKKEENWELRISAAEEVETTAKLGSGLISLWWATGFWAISLIAALVTILWYPSIPSIIPIHFDLAGNADAYATKNPGTVAFMIMIMAFMSTIFTFVLFVIRRSRTIIAADNPEESLYRSRVFRRSWSIFTLLMGNALLLLFMFIQFSIIGLISSTYMIWAVWIVLVFTLGGTLGLTVFVGQGGSRLKYKNHKNSEVISFHENDRYWLLGQFYFNRQDSTLFVEKRFGIGWTFNFAHPLAWVILGGLFLATGLIIFFSFKLV